MDLEPEGEIARNDPAPFEIKILEYKPLEVPHTKLFYLDSTKDSPKK